MTVATADEDDDADNFGNDDTEKDAVDDYDDEVKRKRRRMPLTRMPVMSPMERISPHSHSGPNWPRTT